MDAWAGLLGAVIGGLLTLGGQQFSARYEAKRQQKTELLSNMGTLVALSEDYRNRIWEERNGLSDTAVAGWDLGAYRLAQAHLRILLSDDEALTSISRLQDAGIALGRAWRTQKIDRPEVQTAWEQHKDTLDEFVGVARRLIT